MTECLKAAGLELLVCLFQSSPGVEHGSTQLAPHQVVGQAEDLSGELGRGIWGEDRGATQSYRKNRETSKYVDKQNLPPTNQIHTHRKVSSPCLWNNDHPHYQTSSS